MSLTITINDIDNLTDLEREVLRYITGDLVTPVSLNEYLIDMGDGNDEASPFAAELAERRYAAAAAATAGVAPDRLPTLPEDIRCAITDAIVKFPGGLTAPANPNLDTNGLPWDKRIHSSSRAKVANGTWKYARGVAEELKHIVEAELRAVQSIPVVVAAGANAVIATPSDDPVNRRVAGEVVGTIAPEYAKIAGDETAPSSIAAIVPAPIVPLPPAVPQAPTAALPMTFAQLMQHITPMLVSGKLNQPILQGVVEKCGLPHLAALGARPDLVETVRAAIDAAMGGAT